MEDDRVKLLEDSDEGPTTVIRGMIDGLRGCVELSDDDVVIRRGSEPALRMSYRDVQKWSHSTKVWNFEYNQYGKTGVVSVTLDSGFTGEDCVVAIRRHIDAITERY